MDAPKPGLEELLTGFQQLREAVIDSSSMIYATKAGFLELLAQSIQLYCIVETICESGLERPNPEIRMIPESSGEGPVDDRVVGTAIRLGLPLISDDRNMLRKAEAGGISYYNSLMMLHFLLFKQTIDADRHRQHLKNLLKHAWYGPEILKYGDQVFRYLQSQGK